VLVIAMAWVWRQVRLRRRRSYGSCGRHLVLDSKERDDGMVGKKGRIVDKIVRDDEKASEVEKANECRWPKIVRGTGKF